MRDATKRANEIIENFRGNADEFEMLKGVLCATHGFDRLEDVMLYRDLIDTVRIAERMDEINAAAAVS